MYKTLKTLFFAGAIAYASSRAAHADDVSQRLRQVTERTIPLVLNYRCNKVFAAKVSGAKTVDNGNVASLRYEDGKMIEECTITDLNNVSYVTTEFAYSDFNPKGFAVSAGGINEEGILGVVRFSKGINDEFNRYGSNKTALRGSYRFGSEKVQFDIGKGKFGNDNVFASVIMNPGIFSAGVYTTMKNSSGYFLGVKAQTKYVEMEVTDFTIKNEVSLDQKIDLVTNNFKWKKLKKILAKTGISGGKTNFIYKKRSWTNQVSENAQGLRYRPTDLEAITLMKFNNSADGTRTTLEYGLKF